VEDLLGESNYNVAWNGMSSVIDVKDVQSRSRVIRSRAELLRSGRELTTKWGITLASACALCLDLLSHV